MENKKCLKCEGTEFAEGTDFIYPSDRVKCL